MTVDEFKASAAGGGAPPPGLTPALLALWHEAGGHWDRAHGYAQEDRTSDGAWVHAYLHRKEGDVGNAGYWYSRAGRKAFSGPLDEEWAAMAAELMARRPA